MSRTHRAELVELYPVEAHLSVCMYVRLPDILVKE